MIFSSREAKLDRFDLQAGRLDFDERGAQPKTAQVVTWEGKTVPHIEKFALKRDSHGQFVTATLEFRNRAEGEQAIHAIKQMIKILDTQEGNPVEIEEEALS